jgi:hypothetical protein
VTPCADDLMSANGRQAKCLAGQGRRAAPRLGHGSSCAVRPIVPSHRLGQWPHEARRSLPGACTALAGPTTASGRCTATDARSGTPVKQARARPVQAPAHSPLCLRQLHLLGRTLGHGKELPSRGAVAGSAARSDTRPCGLERRGSLAGRRASRGSQVPSGRCSWIWSRSPWR